MRVLTADGHREPLTVSIHPHFGSTIVHGCPATHHWRMPTAPDGLPAVPDGLPAVLHRTALLAEGFTDDEIRTSRRTGRWVSVHRGTYCAADAVAVLQYEKLHQLRAWAVASRSPHLVVSHISAAAVLGLPIWGVSLERVHLTRVGQSGGRVSPGRVVHAVPLDSSEITHVAGTRVTTVARTLVDIACSTSLATTVIASDAALRRGLVSPEDLTLALARTRHRRGAAAARRALLFADARSESAGESRTRLHLSAHGLPEPVLQIRVYDRTGVLVGRVDLGYPELGVLVEFDGLVKYRKPFRNGDRPEDVVIAEKRREDLLRSLGYTVVRFVWSDLANPAAMAATVRAALEQGANTVRQGGLGGSWATDPVQPIGPT